MTTNANLNQLNQALSQVNEQYDNNIVFKSLDQISKGRTKFTLTVVSSKGPGARLGFQTKVSGDRRRVRAACWHVHGNFFEALFNIDSTIFVRLVGRKIDINGGNWQDRNIGSYACEC